jgi:hypothetical protein
MKAFFTVRPEYQNVPTIEEISVFRKQQGGGWECNIWTAYIMGPTKDGKEEVFPHECSKTRNYS